MSKYAGRSGRPWRRKRAAFRAKCERANAPCWICEGKFGPIRYDLSDRSKWGFQADHAIVLASLPPGDSRREDERNLRASHAYCNQVRNNGTRDTKALIHKNDPLPTFSPEGW